MEYPIEQDVVILLFFFIKDGVPHLAQLVVFRKKKCDEIVVKIVKSNFKR